jgi:hypothetical protein
VGKVEITHNLQPLAIAAMFRGSQSGLGRNMAKRAVRVTAAAKANLSRPPRRVDTGALRADVNWEFIFANGLPGFRVGTSKKYGVWVHDGTGIYGPRRTPITPKRARVLVFRPKGGVRKVFVKSVKGMRPNRFLADAIPAAKL